MIDKKALGARIKNARTIANNLTMEEFANKIHETNNDLRPGKSNVSRWEKGENIPHQHTLEAIAELGNTSVNELLYGSPIEFAYNKLNKEYEENTSFRGAVDSALDVRDELKGKKDFFRDQLFMKIAEEIARDDIYSLHDNYVRNSTMVFLLEKKDKGLDELDSRAKELETLIQKEEEKTLYLEEFVSVLRKLDKEGDNIQSEDFDKKAFAQLIKKASKITNKLIELGIEEI